MQKQSLSADDDEEDFLELLGNTPDKLNMGAVAPIHPQGMDLPVPSTKSFEPVHHIVHSDDERDNTESDGFASILSDFYSRHNFANLDKVPYLVDKFCERKWDMWEQLCIKYKLSARDATKLWMDFGLMSEFRSRFFQLSGNNPSNDARVRKDIWLFLLGCSEADHAGDYELFKNMQLKESDNSRCHIAKDVCRTHQDFEFFQKV